MDLHRGLLRLLVLASLAMVATTAGVSSQSSTGAGEWPTYGGDLGNSRYSPLDQINAGNFSSLEVAWRFDTSNLGPGPNSSSKGRR